MQKVISKLKIYKAPGPDGIITELFKWLDQENCRTFAQCLNIFWTMQKIPQDFIQVYMACIYKKGTHNNPENYRPISLLKTTYKIFAGILHSRIASVLDKDIGDTQYGFRQKRSIAEPLYCIRRFTDFAEQGNNPLYLIFLDWKKAFYKIDHTKMFISLRRLGIPESIFNNIKALYKNPTFKVVQGIHKSQWY